MVDEGGILILLFFVKVRKWCVLKIDDSQVIGLIKDRDDVDVNNECDERLVERYKGMN